MNFILNIVYSLQKFYDRLNSRTKKISVFGIMLLGLIFFFIPNKFISFIGLFMFFGILYLLFMFKLNLKKDDVIDEL
jgi:hypothetical protein